MKLQTAALILLIGIGIGLFFNSLLEPPIPTGMAVLTANATTVFFCPQDPCAKTLENEFASAKKTIDIAIYSFTLGEIANELIAAHDRGVQVRVLFDQSQANSQYSVDETLEQAGVIIKRMDKTRGILHDKFAVIDNQTVATGSYNYSQNATSYNNENLLVIPNEALAGEYETEFESLWNATK